MRFKTKLTDVGRNKITVKRIFCLVALICFSLIILLQQYSTVIKAEAINSLYNRAFSYQVYTALINEGSVGDGSNECSLKDSIGVGDVEEGSLFSNELLTPDSVRVGMLIDPDDDGTLSCGYKDFDDWVGKAIGIWGYKSNGEWLDKIGYDISDDGKEYKKKDGWSVNNIYDAIPSNFTSGAAVYYYIWEYNFRTDKGCRAQPIMSRSSEEFAALTENDKKLFNNEDKYLTTTYADPDKNYKTYSDYIYEYNDRTMAINVGFGDELESGDEQLTCKELAENMKKPGYIEAYAAAKIADKAAGFDDPGAGGAGGSSGGSTDSDNCFSLLHPGTWFICPMITIASDFAEGGQKIINNLLQIDTTGEKSSVLNADGLRTAWSAMRVISSIALVAMALFMIISQILGFEFFSNYTVKKVAPKLVIAVILIQLSWLIFYGLIGITNILGLGIQQLLYAPFGLTPGISAGNIMGNADILSVTTGGLGMTMIAVGSVAGVFAMGFGILLGVLILILGAAFAVLMAMVVLILRQILIVALLVVAPIAIVLWILPGTEKYWKQWWSNFSKMLMMYPLIMGMLAVGVIFADLTARTTAKDVSSDPDNGPLRALVSVFTIIIAFFGPYFLIPKTFKWGGTLMGAVGGAVTKFGERTKKGIMDSKAMQNVKEAHKQNVVTKGYENIGSGSRIRKNYGRWQAGTFGAYGKYGEQLRQTETVKDEQNAANEHAQMFRGINPNGAGFDPITGLGNVVDEIDPNTGLPTGRKVQEYDNAGNAVGKDGLILKDQLGKILLGKRGSEAMINGKKVTITRRMQQAAAIHALQLKYSDLVDAHLGTLDDNEKKEFRGFAQNHGKEFDDQMADYTRGVGGKTFYDFDHDKTPLGGYDVSEQTVKDFRRDAKGVQKKTIQTWHDGSGKIGTDKDGRRITRGHAQYGRKNLSVDTIKDLGSSVAVVTGDAAKDAAAASHARIERIMGAGQLTDLSNNREIKLTELEDVNAEFAALGLEAGDMQEVRNSGGSLRFDSYEESPGVFKFRKVNSTTGLPPTATMGGPPAGGPAAAPGTGGTP